MARLLRFLFFALIVRPVVLVVLGLNVRHRERLPTRGPAILVGNHNSHLDTMVMISLLPLKLLPRVRPAAAADYFLCNRVFAWFALHIIGIVPVSRKGETHARDPLAGVMQALDEENILIFFPEGTRGEPERLAPFKSGIAHLAQRRPQVPVIPIYMHGLGKALPRGEGMLVPFFCDVFVGEPLTWSGDKAAYLAQLDSAMRALGAEGHFPAWE